jgi:hypothetical protein
MKSAPKCEEEATEKPGPKRPPTFDEMLDEALDETFPASEERSNKVRFPARAGGSNLGPQSPRETPPLGRRCGNGSS